ncbi:MAG: beta-phosphoglucomutase [Bacteroidota bacterium]|nr:beta-phosphoglucomutase [Bacteroidota bacterium]
MSQIKACIFDLDGVIVDTAKYHYLAWKRLANELGFDLTEQQNEQLKGISRMASLDILLGIGDKFFDDHEKQELAGRKNAWYREYITQMKPDEIFPGVIKFLNEVKAAGISTAIGSASKNAMTILEQLGIVDYFDSIIDGNKAKKAKPDPEVFLQASVELGVLPGHCVVFEDAQAGVEAARNGGMFCVGVGSPLILGLADIVVAGLHEMKIEMLDF